MVSLLSGRCRPFRGEFAAEPVINESVIFDQHIFLSMPGGNGNVQGRGSGEAPWLIGHGQLADPIPQVEDVPQVEAEW